jgi:hypothetical protein
MGLLKKFLFTFGDQFFESIFQINPADQTFGEIVTIDHVVIEGTKFPRYLCGFLFTPNLLYLSLNLKIFKIEARKNCAVF